jgi:hypothetical protein
MKKELKVTEETSIVVQEEVNMCDIEFEAKDLVYPKLLIQQSMSEAVKQKTAEEGDIVNNLTNENLGKVIQLLPFYKKESIIVEKWNGRKFEYLETRKYNGKVPPFEEEINGVRFKNSCQYLIYCLTSVDSMPHIISFKGTSRKIGSKLLTMMVLMNKAQGLPTCGKWITFSAATETSKSGDKYLVSSFVPSRVSTKEEIAKCEMWKPLIKDSDSEIAPDETPSSSQESVVF